MEDLEDIRMTDDPFTEPEGSGEPEAAEEPAAEEPAAEEPAAEESAETEEAQEEEAPEEEPKKGLFGRREKKELEKKDQQIAELNDKYLRTMAEYDNFRKRTEKETADIYTFAAKDVLTKILPVLDNFERGLAQLPEEKKDDPVAEGMEKIYKQFEKALADLGVEPIEAVGHAFDPDFHNAVMHVEDEEAGDNVVVEELMRGYTYKGTVIRYAMVKVAN